MNVRLKMPPLLLVLTMGLGMKYVASLAPSCRVSLPGRYPVAWLAATAGAVICTLGVMQLWRTRTTVNPMKPESASSLVVTGIYGVTRNPMYLGLLLSLFGWAYFLSNGLAFIFLPVFVWYMNRFQIQPEETALSAKFGKDFATYCSRVRRWL